VVEAAIEITRTTAPTVAKGFHLALEVLRPRAAYLVHGGSGQWPLGSGITAISPAELMLVLGGAGGSDHDTVRGASTIGSFRKRPATHRMP